MTYHILGCGESCAQYHGHGLSIGVNDCFKYGKRPNILGIWNHRNRFTPDRVETIKRTNPVKLYTDNDSWEPYFENRVHVKLRSWDGHLRKEPDRLAHAHTSPFIAMSLAYNLGASKIILWGADFVTHKEWTKQNPQMAIEMRLYEQLINSLRREDVKVYLGAGGGLLEKFLTVNDGMK